jgi:hypothetical protein
MRHERLYVGASGRLAAFVFLALALLSVGTFIGSFTLAAMLCVGEDPACDALAAARNRMLIAGFVGLVCVVLSFMVDGLSGGAVLAVRPGILLAAAAGVCGLVALASFALGAFLFPLDLFLFLLIFLLPFVVALLLLLFPVWVVRDRSGW